MFTLNLCHKSYESMVFVFCSNPVAALTVTITLAVYTQLQISFEQKQRYCFPVTAVFFR